MGQVILTIATILTPLAARFVTFFLLHSADLSKESDPHHITMQEKTRKSTMSEKGRLDGS